MKNTVFSLIQCLFSGLLILGFVLSASIGCSDYSNNDNDKSSKRFSCEKNNNGCEEYYTITEDAECQPGEIKVDFVEPGFVASLEGLRELIRDRRLKLIRDQRLKLIRDRQLVPNPLLLPNCLRTPM